MLAVGQAKLSDWQKQILGEPAQEGGKNVTKLVAGVSPFLEAFGNAKTNMNDNSSRFGQSSTLRRHPIRNACGPPPPASGGSSEWVWMCTVCSNR